jgi:lipopolysaccharide export LptBFGC system permease protein LptF
VQAPELILSKKERKARLQQLEESIAAIFEIARREGEAHGDRNSAILRAIELTRYEKNELDHLRQQPMRLRLRKLGIKIPDEHYLQREWPMKTSLTYVGELWGYSELRKARKAEIEFWAKIVLPILSIVLSIIALVKRHC